MRPVLFAACAGMLWLMPHAAWPQGPVLTGTVDVDVRAGVLRGDLCLQEMPTPHDSASFVLNHGMNVKRVRDGAGTALAYRTRPEPDGFGVRYSVALPVSEGARTLCVAYVGAFPVYDVAAADYRLSDGSSVIAFNGRTVRARGETRWYPAPLVGTGSEFQSDLAYRLTVRCPGCTYIYLNGAPPSPGPEAQLSAEAPRELLLFAGDYPLQVIRGVHFLGEAVPVDTAELFLRRMGEVQEFYESFLGVPYGEPIDVLRIIPVRYDRPGQFWGFFADPALGLVGLTIAEFVEILGDPGHPGRPVVLGVLAHELAHRYFAGTIGGPLYQFFSEPFANYLDLKATQHFHGEEAYQQRVRALGQRVIDGPDLPPLPLAEPDDLSVDAYRYGYAPLLLLTLERELGEGRMRALLNALLMAPGAERGAADYAFLRRAALRSGVADSTWHAWEEECLMPAISENQCFHEVIN